MARKLVLGEGTYAQVTSMGTVAIKTVPHKNFESAIREISLVNACEHPNVIGIDRVELGPASTAMYMKRYSCDLSTYGNTWGLLPVETVFAIAKGMLAGIAHVHSKGIIHGDIKPQNILLDTPVGCQPNPVICDFGIAVMCNEKYHTSRVQTCTYRAPEVNFERVRVQYTTAIDMWSIGCILLELASGAPTVNYVNGVEDPSWYACKLFGIQGCTSRKQRLRMLRDVNAKYIHHIISLRFQHDVARYKKLCDSKFMQLVEHCLHPNHVKRVNAQSALNYMNNIIRVNQEPAGGSPVVLRRVPVDELECVVNVDCGVLVGCKGSCLDLAESIYERYSAATDDISCDSKYACLFMAACMFSGNSATNTIYNIMTRDVIYKRIENILKVLNYKVFELL